MIFCQLVAALATVFDAVWGSQLRESIWREMPDVLTILERLAVGMVKFRLWKTRWAWWLMAHKLRITSIKDCTRNGNSVVARRENKNTYKLQSLKGQNTTPMQTIAIRSYNFNRTKLRATMEIVINWFVQTGSCSAVWTLRMKIRCKWKTEGKFTINGRGHAFFGAKALRYGNVASVRISRQKKSLMEDPRWNVTESRLRANERQWSWPRTNKHVAFACSRVCARARVCTFTRLH